MELIGPEEMPVLTNPGYASRQLLFPGNSRSERVTITRVVMEAGAVNRPHRHTDMEQVWIALRGHGHFLLEHGRRLAFGAGQVARFEDNELHGFECADSGGFEYLSVTSPPADFRPAYEGLA